MGGDINMVPHEIDIGGVYLPPLLLVGLLAVTFAWGSAEALNRLRLSRFFAAPPLVFIALVALYGVLLGTFLIRI